MNKKKLKKSQLKIRNILDDELNTFDNIQSKEFKVITNELENELTLLYESFNFDKKSIDILLNNPQFTIGLKDIKTLSNKKIKSLFENYKEQLDDNLVASYNKGFAARIWEAEISQAIIYDVTRQPLPFVENLLINKKRFGYTIGERIKTLTNTTIKKVSDHLESSLLSGSSLKDTTNGIRDIIGYDINGKRVKGALASAKRISRTEIGRAYNTAQDLANNELKSLGVESIDIWRATLDRRTRPYHLAADDQRKGQVIKGAFLVGGETAQYPQAPTLSARNSINCRCYIEYTTEPDKPTLRAVRKKEKLPSGRRQLPVNLKDASWKKWKTERLSEMGINTTNFSYEK